MGKFIEVSYVRSRASTLVNINYISKVAPDSTKRAYIIMADGEEIATNHSYDEIRRALFLMGETQPVYEVDTGDLKHEK